MAKKKIVGRLHREGPTPEESRRLAAIREKVRQEFPPRDPPRLQPATAGVAAQIRRAREAQGLSWYAVAKRAGIPNSNTVRDIEYGRDVKLSNLESVAAALGLKLELVEAATA
jgi:ribosome-binding protein aMBF1 (putative translation factor)